MELLQHIAAMVFGAMLVWGGAAVGLVIFDKIEERKRRQRTHQILLTLDQLSELQKDLGYTPYSR